MGSSRSIPLDFLRGIAILLVLGRHLPDVPAGPGPLLAVLRAWQRFGWSGVDLFFVLSGFLVSSLLFNEWRKTGRVDAGRFLIRRGFKIYPAFYVLFFVSTAFLYHGFPASYVWAEALFLQSYLPHLWGHTWSLAIEEHFYLALALLVFLLARRRPEEPFAPIVPICAVVAVLSPFLRHTTIVHDPAGAALFRSHLRFDSLFIGVLAAYFACLHPETYERWVRRRAALLWSLALAVPAFLALSDFPANAWTGAVVPTVVYLSYAALLVCFTSSAAVGRLSGSFWFKAVAWTGRYSYSIYLWHFFWRKVTPTMLPAWVPGCESFYVRSVFYAAAALAHGVVMAKLIETPFLRLRDRLHPSR